MSIVSGGIINCWLRGKVRNNLVHRFGCSEAATHGHSYLGAVAVGDIHVVQHRDSTSCLGRAEVFGRACRHMIDGFVVELVTFDRRKSIKIIPAFVKRCVPLNDVRIDRSLFCNLSAVDMGRITSLSLRGPAEPSKLTLTPLILVNC